MITKEQFVKNAEAFSEMRVEDYKSARHDWNTAVYLAAEVDMFCRKTGQDKNEITLPDGRLITLTDKELHRLVTVEDKAANHVLTCKECGYSVSVLNEGQAN